MTEPTRSGFYDLQPDTVLDAVEGSGVRCDGRLLPLNSFENRVYQVGIDDQTFLVSKFYRPGRWSDEQILEEHVFSEQLAAAEVPVVAPLRSGKGETLRTHREYRFALYPRRGGRPPQLDNEDHLRWLGRQLGRLHAIGRISPFRYRPALDVASFGTASREFLIEQGAVPEHVRPAWESVSRDLLQGVESAFEAASGYTRLRVHGDCHSGNIMWTDAGPHFVDLDDSRNGPAIQDLWMLLSGERDEQCRQLSVVLEGYEQFSVFDAGELRLLEALRSLRLLSFSAWIARRWEDPAFPAAFPWFGGYRYWEEQVLTLREQMAALNEPPLNV